MNKPEAKPAPLMLARIPNTKHGRATLGGIREFLNTDGYRLAVEFSGPRRKNERGWLRYGTLKEDATAFRLYVTRKRSAAGAAEQNAWLRATEAEGQLRDARSHVFELQRDKEAQRANIARLQNDLAEANEDKEVAQMHAIDQDGENEALRADLAAVPAWVKAALRAWHKLVDAIVQPDPRG